jgi:hypothetical protein
MPIDIGARPKNFRVFFFRPLRVPELVSCIEVFFSTNVNHLFLKFAAKLGKRTNINNPIYLLLKS